MTWLLFSWNMDCVFVAIPPLPPPKAKKSYTNAGKRNKLQRELQNLQSLICYDKSATLAIMGGDEDDQ